MGTVPGVLLWSAATPLLLRTAADTRVLLCARVCNAQLIRVRVCNAQLIRVYLWPAPFNIRLFDVLHRKSCVVKTLTWSPLVTKR